MVRSSVAFGIETVRDHLSHERLAGDDTDEPTFVGDVDSPDLRPLQELTGRLRRRVGRELSRVRDHGVADGVHGKIPRA